MDKAESFLLKHLLDLDRIADQRYYTKYSEFLNLAEQNVLISHLQEFRSGYKLFGGYKYSERQMVAFSSDALSLSCDDFPISCLKITPINAKFAEDLSHRDVLGSLMNTGIERNVLGDIILQDENIYVLCLSSISSYIIEELHKIRHTMVRIEEIPLQDFDYVPSIKECTTSIASNRLDAFIAAVCNLSRQKSTELILSEKVYINGKNVTDYNCKLNQDDIISIRGFGKLIFKGIIGESKKQKLRISYGLYE